ncbi:DUF1768-domain-containing protein [Poronia punctata]|nr:DUF1768-domain-containing protein [Poronia punctata]
MARKHKHKHPSKKTTTPTTTTPSPDASSSSSSSSTPLFFWKPTEPETGYLSQWYVQPFRDSSNKTYPTAEHYMMHHKALLFRDEEIARFILETDSPRAVKSLGRAVRNFDDKIWLSERERIVTEGNYFKFAFPVREKGDDDDDDDDGLWRLGLCDDAKTVQAPRFRDVLLATGDRELVEASTFDRIWGIGFAAKGAEAKRHKWGENLLGKCLMEARDRLRKEVEAEAETAMMENGEEVHTPA